MCPASSLELLCFSNDKHIHQHTPVPRGFHGSGEGMCGATSVDVLLIYFTRLQQYVVAVLLCNSVVAADTMTAGSCWEMQHTTRYPGNLGFGRACNTPPLAALRSLQQRLPTFGRGCVCCCCRACMFVCMYAHTCSIHVAYVHREIS